MTSTADAARFQPFDRLATLIAVVREDGIVVFANTALEDALGVSRRTIERSPLADFFCDRAQLRQALQGAGGNVFAALRYDAMLRRPNLEPWPVHVIVTQAQAAGEIIVELLPLEQQARQEREERQSDQVQAGRELLRNLAHEVKNPLGGIRGAAQLLEMEVAGRGLTEYTQVIIREADRLQSLVDRLLAPHRIAQQLAAVNIHEVCERVRALLLAEFPHGLRFVRDYDTSIPELHADFAQLMQVVLNVTRNACEALSQRITAGDACLTLRTRVARQVTFGRQRYRLALELHVIDNGPGVPDALKERIFHPLVSGREGGSGLGLTLAQTFVQQHHGLIEVDSVPGRTDFRVLIPLP